MLVKIYHYSKNALANPGLGCQCWPIDGHLPLPALVNSCYLKFNQHIKFYSAFFCVYVVFLYIPNHISLMDVLWTLSICWPAHRCWYRPKYETQSRNYLQLFELSLVLNHEWSWEFVAVLQHFRQLRAWAAHDNDMIHFDRICDVVCVFCLFQSHLNLWTCYRPHYLSLPRLQNPYCQFYWSFSWF